MPPLIRRIDAADTMDLRHNVLWPDLPRDAVILPEDATAFHFGAFVDEKLVGVASLFPNGTTARLRKLAVAHDHQGQGIASHLLQNTFTHMHERAITDVWCDARVSATAFYERLGFVCDQQVFQKQGVDYVKASKSLSD